jgi:hypothetical protein
VNSTERHLLGTVGLMPESGRSGLSGRLNSYINNTPLQSLCGGYCWTDPYV